MRLIPPSLSLRLALMFSLVSLLVLGSIGFFLYQSLQKELSWRDDQALIGRLERMEALLDDSDGIEILRSRPKLYDNMLGNRQNLLWILDDHQRPLIEINPVDLPVPQLQPQPQPRLTSVQTPQPMRLAWVQVIQEGRPIQLIAGKLLAERNQMLDSYRFKLFLALTAGALLAFMLGWLVSQRGLQPVRKLAAAARAIDARNLHHRLDKHQQTQELRELSAALNQMLTRLESGFGQLSRFSEDLAHEMRTPLSNLMGQTQLHLRQPRSSEAYQDLLASNLEEYERLARMIDSMLFLARTEQPGASIQRQSLRLDELGGQLCDYFEGMAEDRGMTLHNGFTGQLCADPDLLRRALANLLANAVRYGTAGTGIRLYSRHHNRSCQLCVENVSTPIPQEQLPYLFDRFYRCDPSRSCHGDSGGLGLAIVRSIAQLHGGSIHAESDTGSTRFTLTLPQSGTETEQNLQA